MNQQENQHPGISLRGVHLARSAVELRRAGGNQSGYNLQILQFDRVQPDGADSLLVVATFDLMHGVNDPPFALTCTLLASYAREVDASMNWSDLEDSLVLAHLLPFVREYVANITSRLPIRPILLPPLNTILLLKQFESRNAGQANSDSTAPSAD